MEKGIVQQVGSPTEIYDTPANTFVAGFIGNPAMNLIEGSVKNGVFSAAKTEIQGLATPDHNITLGFRAEDASVVTSGGQINAPIYTLELLGDATMVTVRIGGWCARNRRTRCNITSNAHVSQWYTYRTGWL